MKPLWLLDIDGVLNALSLREHKTRWPKAIWLDGSIGPGDRRFRFTTAVPVCDFIREVHAAGLVEIRWHTTWQHDAQIVADFLELPVFLVQEAPEYSDMNWKFSSINAGWWKLPSVRRICAEFPNRPLIWTDDEIKDHVRKGDDLLERTIRIHDVQTVLPSGCSFTQARRLFITPHDGYGLSPVALETIRGFLLQHQESEASVKDPVG